INWTQADWETVESIVGFHYPEDFKNALEIYGLGWFDDYLFLLPPRAGPNYYGIANFLDRSAVVRELLRDMSLDCSVAPMAFTRSGEEIYVMPDSRIVAVSEDDQISIETGPVQEFLVRLLLGQLKLKGFG